MGKLIKCHTCGQPVAAEAKACPHCGAKNKKKSGCGTWIVTFLLIGFISTAIFSAIDSRNDKKAPEGYKVVGENVAFTTSASSESNSKINFDETELWSLAQIYAEKRLAVKTRLKWKGYRKIEKLRKSGNFPGEIYAVEQDFTVLNAYNVEVKHHARIVMEFDPDRGYRGVWLTVDGKSL